MLFSSTDETCALCSLTNSRTSAVTFGDGAGEVAYAQLTPASDVARIINHSVAQRVGGTLREDSDATSIGHYFEHAESNTDLLYQTDLEVVDFIGWRLNHYKTADVRISEMRVDPMGPIDLWEHVMGRSLVDRCTVKKRLPDGTVILNRDHLLEGITHRNVVGHGHSTSFYVSAAETQAYLVLDDATLGQLDSNALAF